MKATVLNTLGLAEPVQEDASFDQHIRESQKLHAEEMFQQIERFFDRADEGHKQ